MLHHWFMFVPVDSIPCHPSSVRLYCFPLNRNKQSRLALDVCKTTKIFTLLYVKVVSNCQGLTVVNLVAVEMARVASEVKAGDIKVLFVKPLVYWTRFFIIATGFSRPQVDAIGYKIRH